MKKLTFAHMINVSLAIMVTVALLQTIQINQVRRDVAFHMGQVEQIAQERAVIFMEDGQAVVDK